MYLTEAEDIEKRWQKYTEELYKKYLHDPDNHNDVITHLKPLILECKVKWTLGSITTNKASGGDEIPVELFQILKDNAISAKSAKSAALNTPANLENSAVATGLEKVSFHSNSKERHCQKMFRLLHNCPRLTHYQSNAELSQAKKKVLHLCVQGHSVMSHSLQPCRLWHVRFLYQRVSPQGKDTGVYWPILVAIPF